MAELAAETLEELLEAQEEGAAVLLTTTPWRRHCRRIVRHVLADG